MEYDNIFKSAFLGTPLHGISFGNKESSSNKFSKCSMLEVYKARQHIKGSGMCFSKQLWVILTYRSFFPYCHLLGKQNL